MKKQISMCADYVLTDKLIVSAEDAPFWGDSKDGNIASGNYSLKTKVVMPHSYDNSKRLLRPNIL
jgi:hypothetical protein